MEEGYRQAVCAVETILMEGADAAMNLYNRKAKPKKEVEDASLDRAIK